MLATLLLLAAPMAGPDEAPGSPSAPPPLLEATAAAAAKPARLRLGTFGLAALRPPPPPPVDFEVPRFGTRVDVDGWVKRDPNDTMALFTQHWKLESSIYGRGIAIQSTPGGAFNVLPLVDWGWKKWFEKPPAPPP